MGRFLLLILTIIVTVIPLSLGQNYQVTFQIDEESDKDTFVGNVSSSAHFLQDIPAEEIGYIHYGFLQQNYIQTLLSLHEKTGVLSTSVVIDRESKNICLTQSDCELKFDLAVRSSRPQSSFFAIISVTLIIRDTNDNAPLFPKSIINLVIPESTINGTAFRIDSAIDLDAGMHSVQSYEIGKQDGNFGLDVVRKLDGSFTVKLVVNSTLDREVKSQYSVVIIAIDGGTPRTFGALSVNISISDVNDNAPVFTELSYNVTIKENITVGTTILQVKATDDDTGENGEILYRFSQHQLDARVNGRFSIQPVTGELKLERNLVYESGTSYKLIIEATDRGHQPQVTQVIVTVHVTDVGNNKPVMQINLLSQTNSRIVNLSESAVPGTFVAHVNVIDTDSGANGEVSCVINDHMFELLSMSGKGYKVVVKGDLDRETKNLHDVIISCHDNGSPPESTSAGFRVSLSDVNDCAPVFTRPIFTGSIPENMKIFRTFVQISAVDRDLGPNGHIRYYVDEDSTTYKFTIDELSGNLRADQIFDREQTREITFRVIAVDNGSPRLSSATLVKVTIEDRNDNRPEILEPKNFTVGENLTSNTFVGQLKARDLDIFENAEMMFVIKPEFEFRVPFVVFPDGKIKTNQQLDREVQSQYTFCVIVFDQGSPRLSSSANITINVNDTNDNPPKLIFPSEKNNTVVVFSNRTVGDRVIQIDAMDMDEGINQISTYDIVAGNDEDVFIIDSKLGGIYLTREMKIKENRSFHLTISVKDGGTPPLTTREKLNVILAVSNVTSLTMSDKKLEDNMLIVIVVVVVTIVLSLIMITIIYFIKRFDSRRKIGKDCHVVAPDEKYPTCYLDDHTRYLDNNSSNSHDHLTLTYDPLSSLTTKKKEVSFDIDEPIHRQRDMHNSTMSTFSAPDIEKLPAPVFPDDTTETSMPKPSNQDQGRPLSPASQGKPLNQIQLLQYQQAVLECQTQAWLHSQHDGHEEGSSFDVTLTDDKCSDTSEEVTASDSGKGGSEDDIPSNNSKDKDFKNHNTVPVKLKTHHYVAPEFRHQGELQRRACDINDDHVTIHSPASPTTMLCNEDLCHPSTSSCSGGHSTPRSASRNAMYYARDYTPSVACDRTGEAGWDAASYV